MQTLTLSLACSRCAVSITRTITVPVGTTVTPATRYICPACGESEPGKFSSTEHAENYLRKARRLRWFKEFLADDLPDDQDFTAL